MDGYKEQMKNKMKAFAHAAYRATKAFSREELYGMTSQLRRASLSVPLNYVEGYARRKQKTQLQFIETAYGSLQECKCLIEFASEEKQIGDDEKERLMKMADEIGAILWSEMKALDQQIENA